METSKKIYLYRNKVTTDEDKLDDIIFNELSKYKSGYPSDETIAAEKQSHAEEVPYTPEALLGYIRNNYRWEQ
jgi:hypothetical protein